MFRVRRRYVWTMYVLALVASSGIAFVVGNRGNALISLALLLGLPTGWTMLMINLRLFPVDIEIIRAGWTPGDSETDQELEREFELLREFDLTGTHAGRRSLDELTVYKSTGHAVEDACARRSESGPVRRSESRPPEGGSFYVFLT